MDVQIVSFTRNNFISKKYKASREGINKLEIFKSIKVILPLRQVSTMVIVVKSYTDSRVRDSYQVGISNRRAK